MIKILTEQIHTGSLDDFYVHGTKYTSYLNLETQTRELICGDPNKEFRNCWFNKINFYDMAWSGIFPPKLDNVVTALSVMRRVPKPLLFGCRIAKDRTGFLRAVYRMQEEGWSFTQANKERLEMGTSLYHYVFWWKALKKYEVKK